MKLDKDLHDSAVVWGADYFGIADLLLARDAVLEQGGVEVAGYPYAVSMGLALLGPIVDGLLPRPGRTAAAAYRSHCYNVINSRLDLMASGLAGILRSRGYRAFPVPASRRVDDGRICAVFSHKLAAHLAGLGWIGKNCLLITPDRGPRVRWVSVLTDAPLKTVGQPMDQRCGDCLECVTHCPMKAFSGQPFHAGEPRSVRFDAARCDRYFSKMREKDAHTAVCGLCLVVCPQGVDLDR